MNNRIFIPGREHGNCFLRHQIHGELAGFSVLCAVGIGFTGGRRGFRAV